MNINLNLIFKDRVGIVADIATVIAGKGLNISFMEVVLEEGKAIIYLEVENPKDGVSQEEIFKMLGAIPDLIEIRFIKIKGYGILVTADIKKYIIKVVFIIITNKIEIKIRAR